MGLLYLLTTLLAFTYISFYIYTFYKARIIGLNFIPKYMDMQQNVAFLWKNS